MNMAAIWFYIYDGTQHQGPVTIEDLTGVLLAAPEPHKVRIWREGMPDWQDAGSVLEISEKLPPLGSSMQPIAKESENARLEKVELVAKNYRLLVLFVGLQLPLGLFQLPAEISPFPRTGVFALVLSIAVLGILMGTAFTAYELTRHLGERLPFLWAVFMFIPCLNIFFLLALSSKAQVWCQRNGIKVGFFGPTKESIEELQRRS